jgi:hypothetical protein
MIILHLLHIYNNIVGTPETIQEILKQAQEDARNNSSSFKIFHLSCHLKTRYNHNHHMTLNDPRVVELVKQRGWFGGDEELALASGRAVSYLVEKDPTAFEKIGKAFAAKYNVPFIDLSKFPAATSLPSDVKKFTELINATVLKITPDTVFLATSDEDTLKSPNDTPLHVAYPVVKVGFAFDPETARLDPLVSSTSSEQSKPEDDAQAPVIEKKQIIKAAEPVSTPVVAPVEIRAEEMVSLQPTTVTTASVPVTADSVQIAEDADESVGSPRRNDARALDPPNKSEDDAQSVDAQKPSIKFVEPMPTETPETPKGPLRRLVKLLAFDEATRRSYKFCPRTAGLRHPLRALPKTYKSSFPR